MPLEFDKYLFRLHSIISDLLLLFRYRVAPFLYLDFVALLSIHVVIFKE